MPRVGSVTRWLLNRERWTPRWGALARREVPGPIRGPDRRCYRCDGACPSARPRRLPAWRHHLVRRVQGGHRKNHQRLLPAASPPRVPPLPQAGATLIQPASYTSRWVTTASPNTPTAHAGLERHPRIILHFTSTSGSWLNMVEIFLASSPARLFHRGSFVSVHDLINAIHTFIDGWNDRYHPFM